MLYVKKLTILFLLLPVLVFSLTNATPAAAQSTSTIVIIQDTIPNAGQNFQFSISPGLSPANFQLDDDTNNNLSNTRTYNNVPVGSYTLSQTPVEGYHTTIFCENTSAAIIDGTASFLVESNETVTCTFTSTKLGSVRIVKDTVPDTNDTFTFSTNGGLDPFTFDLTDDGSDSTNTQTFDNVFPGEYTVTELADSGYTTTVNCIDPSNNSSTADNTATIDLAFNEKVLCIFTNVLKPSKLVVINETVPDDAQDFSYTIDGGLSPSTFSLDDDGETATSAKTQTFNGIAAGDYNLSVDAVAGYDTSVDCDDPSGGTLTIGGNAAIDLAAGETVTCTYTHAAQFGSVTIIKEANPTDGTDFAFSSDIPGGESFSLDDELSQTDSVNQSITFNNVTPDTYNISESLPSDWNLTSATCTGGSDSGSLSGETLSVAIGASEDVVCIFSNTQTCPAFPITVADEAELNFGIGCYNELTGAGNYAINLSADIDLTASTTTIDNSTSGVELTLNGADFTLDGQNISGVRPLDVEQNTDVTVQNMTIMGGNVTNDGGGIRNEGTLIIQYSTVTDNQAVNLGGGIFNHEEGTLTVANSTISNNSLTHNNGSGGGIYNEGTLTVDKSTISGNTVSNEGGGLSNWIALGSNKIATVSNSTIAENSAEFGGGIASRSSTFRLIHSTISKNSGGGIFNTEGDFTVAGSIIADQQDGGDCVRDVPISNGLNLTSDDSCDFLGDTENGNANLGPLQNNGGPTLTMAPLPGSDAINVAGNTLCDAAPIDGVDQRGVSRLFIGDCDIGAFEATAFNSLTIIKEATPEDGTDFAFTGDLGDFSLDDEASQTDSTEQSITFTDLFLNSYDITETLPAGWQLDSVSCTGGSDSGSLNDETLSITVDINEAVVCTFENSLKPTSLTIIKEASPKDSIDFAFTSNIPGGESFSLDDEPSQTDSVNQTITFDDLTPGTYAITEILPSDWHLTAATCTGGSDSGSLSDETLSVSVGLGEDVVCTFSNTQTCPAFPMTVTNESELNFAIGCYNDLTSGGSNTIDVAADINLTASTTTIDNATSNIKLLINGNNHVIDGANSYRLFRADDSAVTFESLILQNGSASRGGGIYVNSDAVVTVNDSILSGNSASNTGGGIYAIGGKTTVNNSTFSGNSARFGGGIYDNSAPITVNNSTFSNNSAESGGGIYNLGAFVKVNNSTISGNSADVRGAGLLTTEGGVATVRSSTFSSNSAPDGSGILVEGDSTTTVHNTIVADSVNGGDCSVEAFSTLTMDAINLDTDGTCADATTAANINLGPLQDNGGPTETHALLLGSDAIDTGDDAKCTAGPIKGLDQRGVSRAQGTSCDVGAFEFETVGHLTIIKEADPEDGTDFTFMSDILGGTTFSLDDEPSQTDSVSQTITFNDLTPGTYAITETLPADWQLDTAACIDGSGSGTLNGETLSVAIGAGENVVCTFTNSSVPQTGSITIKKVTDPAGSREMFSFSGDLSISDLRDNQSDTVSDLVAGDYTVTEVVPDGWRLDYVVCETEATNYTAITDGVTIHLPAGEDITCTFTNVADGPEPGSLTIIKEATPEDGTNFAFTSDFGDFTLDDEPSQTDSIKQSTAFYDLTPGSYNITELLSRGWNLTDATCTGGSDSGSLNGGTLSVAVGAGEDVVCTFTNVADEPETGTLTIIKEATPEDGTDFAFTSDFGDFTLDDEPSQTDGVKQGTIFNNLTPDSYNITEILPSDWSLTDATCTGGSDSGSLGGETLSVAVGAGEDVVCTFNNVKVDPELGSLTIIKEATPEDGTDFDFISSIPASDDFGIITTVAGNGTGGFSGDAGLAINANLSQPQGVAVDGDGNIFIADRNNHRIRKVDAATGVISTVAGNGTAGFSGDGGLAVDAMLNFPKRVAVDSAGNLFIADLNNARIRKVDGATGIITTVVGGGSGYDGSLATDATIDNPDSVIVDDMGNLYLTTEHRIRKVDATTKIISTVAGTGAAGFGGDGEAAVNARLDSPSDLAIDEAGNLFIADTGNELIRKVDGATGIISTIAGAGVGSDGGPAVTALLPEPDSVAVDEFGNVFIVTNGRIRRIDAVTSLISTVAGGGSGGDGGLATNTALNVPQDIAIDSDTNIFVAEFNGQRIRKIPLATNNFSLDDANPNDSDGVNQSATFADIPAATYQISEIVPDGWQLSNVTCTGGSDSGTVTDETLFVTISPDEQVTCTFNNDKLGSLTIIKEATPEDGTDFSFTASGPSFLAPPVFETQWGTNGTGAGQFQNSYGVAVDASGNVYVVDGNNDRIQKFDSSGIYLSQWGTFGTSDGQFRSPRDIAIDHNDNIYVVDTSNDRIQKFDSNGIYLTQWGTTGSSDGQFNQPYGVAVDSSGNVYVTDRNNHRIQKFDSDGVYLAQWGTNGTGDGQFEQPFGVAIDNDDNVYVADTFNHRIQKFDSDGSYVTQWGTNGTGDGQFDIPFHLGIDGKGNVYVTDFNNHRIQKFDSSGTYLAQWGTNGTGAGQFQNTYGVAVDDKGNVYVTDFNNHRVQKFAPIDVFTLDDEPTQPNDSVAQSITFSNLSLGTYDITETLADGWVLDSATCIGGSDSGSLTNETLSVVVGLGEDITCTFTNSIPAETGLIMIKKVTEPTDSQETFSFSGDLPIANLGHNESDTDRDLPAGDYTVTEVIPDGWRLDSVLCETEATNYTAITDGVTIHLPAGEDIICTFTNIKAAPETGSLTIVKEATPEDGTDFAFTANGPSILASSPPFFALQWGGTRSSDNGQFSVPYDVAVDNDGNVYVAELGNHRIQKFDGFGNFITTWGSQGSGNGQFDNPTGIAVDSDGNVYVTDSRNNRIQKFDYMGNFITTWGSGGSDNGQFYDPRGVAVDDDSNVYVVDSNNDRIQKFDSAGNFIATWGSSGSDNGQFDEPRGITVDSDGNVYVVDANNDRIQKFNNVGSFITTWGTKGSDNGQFDTPYDVAVDHIGNVYVVDTDNDRLQKFDNVGSFITTWGSSGSDNGQFDTPYDVAVDHIGNVYVAERTNNRIQKFTSATNFMLDDEATQTDNISQTVTFGDLAIGSYAITELLPDGWQLDNATCTGGSDNGSLSGETLSIVVGTGENVVCTFTNSKLPETGSITIKKVTEPADSQETFSFSGDVVIADLGHNESDTVNDLVAGDYNVTEVVPDGWRLDSVVCETEATNYSVITDGVTIHLPAGEDIICTFTNVKDEFGTGSLTIVKQTNPSGATGFAFGGDLGDFTLDDGGSFSQENLGAGSYTIFETKASFLDDFWGLLYVSCEGENIGPFYPTVTESNDTFGVEIPLAAEQDLRCTFHNERVNQNEGDDTAHKIYLPFVAK